MQNSPKSNLSSQQAILSLVASVQKILELHKTNVPKYIYLSKIDTILTMLCIAILAATFIYLKIVTDQMRTAGILAESIFLLFMFGLNAFIYERESRIEANDLNDKLDLLLNSLRNHGLDIDIKNWSQIPSVSQNSLIRDDKLVRLPSCLIVKWDVIVLEFGEAAPCKLKYKANDTVLEKSVIFKPSFFVSNNDFLSERQHFFIALEVMNLFIHFPFSL